MDEKPECKNHDSPISTMVSIAFTTMGLGCFPIAIHPEVKMLSDRRSPDRYRSLLLEEAPAFPRQEAAEAGCFTLGRWLGAGIVLASGFIKHGWLENTRDAVISYWNPDFEWISSCQVWWQESAMVSIIYGFNTIHNYHGDESCFPSCFMDLSSIYPKEELSIHSEIYTQYGYTS